MGSFPPGAVATIALWKSACMLSSPIFFLAFPQVTDFQMFRPHRMQSVRMPPQSPTDVCGSVCLCVC